MLERPHADDAPVLDLGEERAPVRMIADELHSALSLSRSRVPRRHLIASGLTGEPTAPVIGIAGATNRNS